MSSITLESHNRAQVSDWLGSDAWVVACLCAAWCDTCKQYRNSFDALALRHPDKRFVWIDIEDQADVVGDVDVDNFPTLLIQRHDKVSFFGTVLPDLQLADRLVQAQTEKSDDEIQAESVANAERRRWQTECNLQIRLKEAD
ncbi:thioredoxin [Noviherbaspirillum cavernae]|uniref:Thioredoxin n=1 Tax=Noviherbaspirillum cavernae TaxID=2320862 RepID=A0A418X0I9_9BURK|nr:thioredoxin family protein [Noviherbaspirillum cavernae]RJG06014.1 thioredoxin [Noviherbaspirillum cavernae]